MGFTIWHNIVYSAKGGCGKTTFSTLFGSLDISLLDSKNSKDESTKNFAEDPLILLDLDLLASNLGDLETDFISQYGGDKDNREHLIYGNKAQLFDFLTNNKIFKYFENCQIKQTGRKFMLINSPDNENVRGWFKAKRRYVPVVKYDEFRYGIIELLRQICGYSNYKANSINIVYDLPPNSDGFTEIIFDILLNKNSELHKFKFEKKVEHKFRLFVLTLPDDSIMKVNLDWLENFLTESGSNQSIEFKYFLVNKYSGGSEKKSKNRATLAEKLEKDFSVRFFQFSEYREENLNDRNKKSALQYCTVEELYQKI